MDSWPADEGSSIPHGGTITDVVRHHLLNGTDIVRLLLLEVLEVQFLDVLRQGNLPRLLPVIGLAPQLLGVHPEFSRHLNMGVGKVEHLSGVDPYLEFGR